MAEDGDNARAGVDSFRSVAATVCIRTRAAWRRTLRRVRLRKRPINQPNQALTSIEIVMDGASYLNWRTDDTVAALVLTPEDGLSDSVVCEPSAGPGPSHGVVDLRALGGERYFVSAQTDHGMVPVEHLDPSTVRSTRNEGRVQGQTWRLQACEFGELLLVSDDGSVPGPRVLALDAGLGAVLLTVGPLREGSWRVELRRRKSSSRLFGWPEPGGDSTTAGFRFSSPHWNEAMLDEDSGVTRWDAYAVREDGEQTEARLTWGGSGISDVRSAQRFRRSIARDQFGKVTAVRPYWTKDQHLSVELNRLENDEGSKA
ncbi:hypothetical protein ACTXMZ_04940 [Brachybacterium alimentarium]|uniref:hypothetical protein n=1 Tax=Brachybacterium alimentarium TaxID=47845 RepID=UPI0011C01F49|nr:hypothetical protein [Brachybacterium alimentarium]